MAGSGFRIGLPCQRHNGQQEKAHGARADGDAVTAPGFPGRHRRAGANGPADKNACHEDGVEAIAGFGARGIDDVLIGVT